MSHGEWVITGFAMLLCAALPGRAQAQQSAAAQVARFSDTACYALASGAVTMPSNQPLPAPSTNS